MYTFKQAVKDSKEYLNQPENIKLLKEVAKRDDAPKYREIILAVDDVYALFYKRLLFKGALFKLYKERKSLNDTIIIPEVIARKIIPMLVMFALCEDYMNPLLEDFRNLILEMMKLTTTYIDVEKVAIKNYREIDNIEM